ncbi:hypothetical protein ARALYDRAFT_324194 [Arabidopsis lyrata subsp. lyrata]|uniref:Uncharacterized protein n=1 Tax=Arabidopsis lyrata subsp. lyrata TaxID=81972 RepID=D7LVK5_ARALL|nr:uncharacterized protein LOC9314183 [Arabidopsis lyrata subsp. lyrata]EFH52642.1 hypothetical protein ARALYDRAFT_324194 [Arabidopsis lyrata subsp. lyrata]|eukprot:XP_002876383.1 uncharacterized protein LOC9314183 [Arabidopsis lyrata subsp. lyrata]
MVVLRSSTHLNSHMHYIRTIQDGSIKILMNMDARRKSKLKFRQLVDIYNLEHSQDDESVPRVVRDLDNVSDITQGSESEDFSMTTLEKIRKQCKEKKRKLRIRGDTTESASNVEVKKEYVTQDEGCDIEEPLSSWDTKFSKRRKKKQERKAKCVSSTSSPSVAKVDLPVVLFHVKPEAWDDSYSVSEAMDCSKESESPTNTVLVEEIMLDSSRDMRLVPYCSAEPIFPGVVAIEEPITTKPLEEAFEDASEEFDDARKVQCCLADNIALQDKQIVLYGSVPREEMELDVNPQHSEYENFGCVENLISSYTSSGCEEAKEDEESNDSKASLDMSVTGLEIVKIEAPEILAIDYSGCLPIINFCIEDSDILWETEDITKDDFPEAADILQLTNCCNSLDNLQPVPDDSTISLEEYHLPERLQQSLYSKHEDEARDHKLSQLYKEPDEFQKVAETDSIQQQQPHHQPENLLSGRKALSPTSQEKLRKAMEHPDSPEKRSKKSRGKLYFSSQNSHRILKAQGLDTIDRVEIIPGSKQAIQKASNKTRQRATHKFPRRGTQAAKAQPFSTGCASIQGCSQKAIAFSQGQLCDFQCVAARLTKELKSMRQITKRCLQAESNTSNISDCNLDEVKTVIGNAEKTEESCKKWLSIIERDCNRFCKLMGMVREDSPATEDVVHKKKKIKFADDAGGDLCHVKVFEIDLESEHKRSL